MNLLDGGCDAGNKLFMSKGATVTAQGLQLTMEHKVTEQLPDRMCCVTRARTGHWAAVKWPYVMRFPVFVAITT
jgi:hypothetical protein